MELVTRSHGARRSIAPILVVFALLLTGCDDARFFGLATLTGAPLAALVSWLVGGLVVAGHRKRRPELRTGQLAQLATFGVLAAAALAAVLLGHVRIEIDDVELAVPGLLTVQLLVWSFWVVSESKHVSWGRAGAIASVLYFGPAVPLALGFERDWFAMPVVMLWIGLFGFGLPFVAVLLGTTIMLNVTRPKPF